MDEGEWSASRPARFTIEERVLGTQWMGRWVGPKTGLDAVAKRKNLFSVLARNRTLAGSDRGQPLNAP